MKHILVFGKVQGVGFRKFAKRVADELGILGSVENLDDGSVEIFAQDCQNLQKFLETLKNGNGRCEVSQMLCKDSESCDNFSEFSIL